MLEAPNLYVISLAKTPQRLMHFKNENPHLGFTVYEAVNGSEIPASELGRYIEPTYQYSPGALGNCLSHQNLWRLAINLNKTITIAEDDAIFHTDFILQHQRLIASVGTAWDFISWGWNFDSTLDISLPGQLSDCILNVNQNQLRENYKNYIQEPIEPSLYKLHQTFGTMAYSISPEGAAQLLKKTHPILRQEVYVRGLKRVVPNVTLDITLSGLYTNMNCFASFPPLALTENRHESSTVVRELQNPT